MTDIILLAIAEEAPDFANFSNVFFTGVGKVNAAIAATRLIEQHRPRRVINFGTAGGVTVAHGLHQCTVFVQRDMHCEALGYSTGTTPFETAAQIKFSDVGLTCSSGDNFVSCNNLAVPADVVDMEAYAIAKVCEQYGVEFECWKYITDTADQEANSDWQLGVSHGQPYYHNKLKDLSILT